MVVLHRQQGSVLMSRTHLRHMNPTSGSSSTKPSGPEHFGTGDVFAAFATFDAAVVEDFFAVNENIDSALDWLFAGVTNGTLFPIRRLGIVKHHVVWMELFHR